jgi:putative FmdB family regulatory protein
MPIYQYKCTHASCGHVFEAIHKHDKPVSWCPICSGTVKKLLSSGSFNMDGKKLTQHPNSPEGMQRTKELKAKHTREGTMNEWKKENVNRAKKDGGFNSYE